MKTLKKALIWILVILIILVIISYILPGSYRVERSIVINADKEIIFEQFCDFNNWDNWAPWSSDLDSTAEYEYIGSCEQGAVQRWEGEDIGNGEMIITKLIPYELMEYDLSFDNGKFQSVGLMSIEPENGEYKLTWVDEGDLGYNPVARYMGLLMDSYIGTDFEQGLTNLKELSEGMPDYPDIEIVEVESIPAIAIKDSATIQTMGEKMGEMFGELMNYMTRKKVEMTGQPYTIYHTWNPEGYTVVEAGIPVDRVVPSKGNVVFTKSPGGKAVKAIYFGSYEGIGTAHEAIEKYVKINKLEIIGPPWDIYITDPQNEPDPAKWETLVLYPIK